MKKFAFLVGISEYKYYPELKSSDRHINRLKKILVDTGEYEDGDNILCLNSVNSNERTDYENLPIRGSIENRFEDFLVKIQYFQDENPDEFIHFIFYFVGHGGYCDVDKINRIHPMGAKRYPKDQLRTAKMGIDLDFFKKLLKKYGASESWYVFFIIDACRSEVDATSESTEISELTAFHPDTDDYEVDDAVVDAVDDAEADDDYRPGIFKLFCCGYNEFGNILYDQENLRYSIFSKIFLDIIENKDLYPLSYGDLRETLDLEVKKLAGINGREQHPEGFYKEIKNLIFIGETYPGKKKQPSLKKIEISKSKDSEFPEKEWRARYTLYEHEGEVSSIQFMRPNFSNTDPEILMSGSKDGKVKFWLVKNRRSINTFDMHSPVNSIALHLDLLAVGTDNYFGLYNISGFNSMICDFRSNEDYEPEKLIGNLTDFRSQQILKPIGKVSFSLYGKYIAIASKSRVLIFDNWQNSIIKEVDVQSNVIALDFIDVHHNFVLGYSSFVEVWSIDGNKPIKKFEPAKGSARTVRALASNTRSEVLLGILYTWSTEGSMVRLWNKNTNSVKSREFKYWNLTSLTFTPDGKFLVLGGDSKQIIFWNLLNDNVKIFKGGSNDIGSISFHENYKSFATSIKGDNSIQIWEEVTISMEIRV